MKIAIDVSQMCYAGTGVARYVRGLTQALLELPNPHDYVLYVGTLRQRGFFQVLREKKPWNQAKWKIFPLPPKLAGYAWSGTSIPFELLTGPVDLIHTSDWSQPSSRLPMVTTVHDLVFKKYPATVDPLILSTQQKRLNKIVQDHIHVITDSKSTKSDLVEIYHLNPSTIDVVYPGIDSQYKLQSKTEIDRVKVKYHLPPKFILSLGTQEPRKNIACLVEAVSTLDLPLVIAGKYGWGKALTPKDVLVLGFVPDADLPGLYAAAEVFAYPSLYEGFGFPVVEAMACGTPVVTSNISSLPEITGEAAILVDPTSPNSLKSGILKASTNRAKLIKAGLIQAKQFTWVRTAQEVSKIYEKIVPSH